ncbi:hypothetical protein [Oceanotoga phage vB_OteS-UFV02]
MKINIGDTVFIEGAVRGIVVGMEGYRESWALTSRNIQDFYFDKNEENNPIIVYAIQTPGGVWYCEEEDLCKTKKAAKKRWG